MKIFKWIFGLFAAIGGILAIMLIPAGSKRKKIKALNEKIKDVDENIKNTENKQKKVKEIIENKKKDLDKIKKEKENFKAKDVSANDAADFLRNYKKKK